MRLVLALVLCVVSGFAGNHLESRLERQLRTWQRRLGMEEWRFALRIVRQSEIDPNSWGSSAWDPVMRVATINVLDPRDYNLKGGELKRDMECTIVHELVHIQVSPLPARNEVEREEAVNRIMSALIQRPCPN
jgi:hypothetical protein